MIKKGIFLVTLFLVSIFTTSFASSFNMTYIYGGSTQTQINNVQKAEGVFNEVSPSYFDLNDDGSLMLTTALDTNFISAMHNMNVKVVPFLSNHWDRQKGRNALNNREELSDQIVEAIEKYNLDGINVDIENVTHLDKDNYTDLVRLLREKLPSDKSVSVAVCANPKGWTTGWHGSYDYEKLAQYCDYIMIMAYDEHYEGGTSGSVASYSFMEDSIKYALKYVESDKIVLGLPFFGRYWNEYDKGGRGVSLKLIDQILKDYNTIGVYDEETKSMKATISVSEEQADNDKYIFSAGTYTFWYENSNTLKEKLSLVEKYNLKGSGSWALGQETNDIWEENIFENNEVVEEEKENEDNVIVDNNKDNEYIENIPNDKVEDEIKEEKEMFKDVNKDSWSYKYIEFVQNNSLMIGDDNNNFRPKDKLTRAETVTIINKIIKEKNIKINYTNSNIKFTDIKGHWAYNEIAECYKKGIIKGYEDYTFKPDEYITREEIVTILDRLNIYNINENKIVYIKDINSNMWSYNSIVKLVKSGIIKGYDDYTFKPKNNITREEITSILYNIFN